MASTAAAQELFSAASHLEDGKHHILLAATGSVATIKIPLIAKTLARHPNLSIRILLTPSAEEFLQGQASEQPALEPTASAVRSLPDDATTPTTDDRDAAKQADGLATTVLPSPRARRHGSALPR